MNAFIRSSRDEETPGTRPWTSAGGLALLAIATLFLWFPGVSSAAVVAFDAFGDLSVVDYDDTYLAAWSTPPLTAVRQPLWEMGRVALDSVLALAAGREPVSRHIELATELVVRGSTSPPAEH